MAEKSKNSKAKKKSPPGPTSLPMFGSLLSLRDKPFHEDLVRLGRKYGPIFRLDLGGSKLVVLNDYDVIREAFVTKGKAFSGRPADPRAKYYEEGYVPKGITDVNYSEEWKRQRSVSMQILRSLGYGRNILQGRIAGEAAHLRDYLTSCGGRPVDPTKALNVTVANVMCALLFGERYEVGNKEFNDLLQCVEDMTDASAENAMGDYVSMFSVSPSYRRSIEKQAEALEKMEAFFNAKVQETNSRIESGAGIESPSTFIEGYLCNMKTPSQPEDQRITENWVTNICIDLFMAAAESTNVTLKWGLLYMAKFHDIQDRVQRDMDALYEGRPHEFSLEDKPTLPYLEAAIMEIQRRACVATLTLYHATIEDVEVAGYFVPKDTAVVANLYAVMMNPERFPEPEKIKPERFLDEEGKIDKPQGWIPFGMGRRMCFAEQLARQELFLFFSTILYHFNILPPDGSTTLDTSADYKLVQKPKPFQVRFEKRL